MSKLNDSIRELLNGRHYATLATFDEDGSIHLTPVWYLFEDDRFFISTGSSSRKVINILANPQVSLIVDIRKLGNERWVSASGTAEIISGEKSMELNQKIGKRYLTKTALQDPRIGPVFAAAGEITIVLTPNSWRSWEFSDLDDQYFDGILRKNPEKWLLPVE